MGFIYCSPPNQVALRDSKTSPRPASARVSWCLETSSIKTPFPGWISILSSLVSLFIFYILSYLLSKTLGCFSGRLMTPASDQKLFCEVCSAFSYSFGEFVGEKVISLSYSSAILAPPPMPLRFNMLSRLVIVCLPRSKRLLISWLQSLSAVILEPKKIKSVTVSTVSPSICYEVMGLDAMILIFEVEF